MKKIVKYTIRVDPDLSNRPSVFIKHVRDILEKTGWVKVIKGLHFVYTDIKPDLLIRLSSQNTIKKTCPSIGNGLSCFDGYTNNILINEYNWTHGVKQPIKTYRQYVILHEVGHFLGLDHLKCECNNCPAPIMMQQTLGIGKCSKNVDITKTDLNAYNTIQKAEIQRGGYLSRDEAAIIRLRDEANKLNNIYYSEFRFNIYVDYSKLINLFKYTRIYYPKNNNLSIIKKLIKEREPVNIGMQRGYDLEQMKKTYGWSTGYYGEYYSKYHSLAPNISLHSRVLFTNSIYNINIIHVIAYAFDSIKQPDYQYIINQMEPHKRPDMIIKRFTHIFNVISKCMDDFDYKYVFLSKFGTGNFATLYKDSIGYGSSRLLQLYNKSLQMSNLINKKIYLIKTFPTNNSELNRTVFRIEKSANLQTLLDKILFVNAWDPWSIPGNGNKGDESLDGYVGRSTTSAICGWTFCNHELNNNSYYHGI